MESKTLIDGTAYSIIGGKTLVNGTSYNITEGATIIDGTTHRIPIVKQQTLDALLSSAELKGSSGNDSSGTATVYVTLNTNGVYYAFSCLNGYLGVIKLVRSGSTITKTVLKQTSSSYGNIYIIGNSCYYSDNGESATNSRGTVSIVSFPGYTEEQADTILNTMVLSRKAGRNSSSSSTVRTTTSSLTRHIVYVSYDDYFAFTLVQTYSRYTLLYGNKDTNPTLLRLTSSNTYISKDGSNNASVYGGSIVTVL